MNLRRYPPKFRRLRRKLTHVLRWHGRSELVAFAGLSVLASFAADFLLELPWLLRLVLIGTFVFGLLRLLRFARQRQRYEVPTQDLLETVEERFPELDGQLMNYTELEKEARRELPFERDQLRSHLLRRAIEEAEAAVDDVRYDRSLDTRPLLKRSVVAAVGLVLLALLAINAPGNFGHWARRNILLSNEAWPRSTHFALDRDESLWRRARGDAFEIRAWVIGEIPRSVKLHLVTENGEHSTRLVPGEPESARWTIASAESAGAPGKRKRVEGRRLTYSVPDVQASFEFYFSGGDNESVPVRVEVRDRPTVTRTQFTLEPPKHTGIEKRVVSNPAGEISMPILTQVHVEIQADQEIHEAWYQFGGPPPQSLDILDSGLAKTSFTLEKSDFLALGLTGGDWQLKAYPVRYALVAIPDRAPEARLQIHGETRLYTLDGQVRYTVEGEDDYGFTAMHLKLVRVQANEAVSTDDRKGVETKNFVDLQPWTAEPTDDGVHATVDRLLELSKLDLAIGMSLILQAQVTDNDAPAGLKTGFSQIETIVIVSAEDLRQKMDELRVVIQTRLEDLADLERALEESLAQTEHPSREQPPDTSSETREQTPETDANDQQRDAREEPSERQPDIELADTRDPSSERQSPEEQAATREQQAQQQRQEQGEQEQSEQEQQAQEQQAQERRDAAPSKAREDSKAERNKERNDKPQSPSEQTEKKPQERSEQQESPSAEKKPAESPEEIARQQREIAEEMRELAEKAREMTEALERNKALPEEEKRRLEDEVHKPLEELARDRLPQSSKDLDAMAKAQKPTPQDVKRARQDMQKISQQMQQVAKRLGNTENFREVLQRMKDILDLQEKIIEKTGGRRQEF